MDSIRLSGDGVAGRDDDDDDEAEEEDDDEEHRQVPGALLVSLTTACGVLLVLSLIWIASRWTLRCRKIESHQQGHPLGRDCHEQEVVERSSSLWSWMQGRGGSQMPSRAEDPSEAVTSESGLTVYERDERNVVEEPRNQDRVALIARRMMSSGTQVNGSIHPFGVFKPLSLSLSLLGRKKNREPLLPLLTMTNDGRSITLRGRPIGYYSLPLSKGEI